MKKINKILIVTFICLLITCGCKKEKLDDITLPLNNGVVHVKDLGELDSDNENITYNFEIINDTYEDTVVDFDINFFSNSKVIENKTITKFVGSNNSELISLIYKKELVKFDNYDYKIKVKDTIIDNEGLSNNIKLNYLENNNGLTLVFDNNSNKKVNVVGIVYYFYGEKLIKNKIINSGIIDSYNIKNIVVKTPKDTNGNDIKFDNVKTNIHEIK